ncbi:MAG TPA: helix-hairpin-helix domain-containing protein [Polyangiaceae bacterium]|nr:helix-hairpin-helix domain-containing protein [Polyangiaceae bacterium]
MSNQSKNRLPAAVVALAVDGQVERLDRRLRDLTSVGPATLSDLQVLGITTVAELARCDARELYERLCTESGARHDPCCEDVFAAAIAQARDPDLPAAQRQWWYWSRQRKLRDEGSSREKATGRRRRARP